MNPSPDPNNNRESKAKKPKLQSKQDTKKIWGAKSLSPEVKEGPKVTAVPRIEPPMKAPCIEPPMKVPPTAPIQPKPVLAPVASTSSADTQLQQKVQIVRSSDGKIQVRGLLPGQQVVQMPGGKLQIVPTTPKPPSIATATTANSSPQQQKQVVAKQLAPGVPIPPGHIAFISGGKTYTIPKSVLPQFGAQQLAPGAPIPPGRTAILSGGKTYTIPKSMLPTTPKSPMKTPRIGPPTNNKDEDVKPFICTSCKKAFNNKACQTM